MSFKTSRISVKMSNPHLKFENGCIINDACSSTVLFPALCVATARWVQPRLCHRSACFNHRSEVPPAYCACACIPKLSQDSPASFLCCFKTSIDCELASFGPPIGTQPSPRVAHRLSNAGDPPPNQIGNV